MNAVEGFIAHQVLQAKAVGIRLRKAKALATVGQRDGFESSYSVADPLTFGAGKLKLGGVLVHGSALIQHVTADIKIAVGVRTGMPDIDFDAVRDGGVAHLDVKHEHGIRIPRLSRNVAHHRKFGAGIASEARNSE